MSGTKRGAAKSVAKLLRRNPNYFKEIGKIGGSRTGIPKGFAVMDRGKHHAASVKGGKAPKWKRTTLELADVFEVKKSRWNLWGNRRITK